MRVPASPGSYRIARGLALLSALGFLARAQITHAVADEIQVADHAAQVEARKKLAAANVADIDKQIEQIDSAIGQATKRGRTTSAMALAEHQTARRDALLTNRARAASALATVEIESAGVGSERAARQADFGPVEVARHRKANCHAMVHSPCRVLA